MPRSAIVTGSALASGVVSRSHLFLLPLLAIVGGMGLRG
jgi:hypothetical protein